MDTRVPMRRVAVIGSGISGAVCASSLVRSGISVTTFESARGPRGRMSQRRETAADGKEVLFDHGAPFFTVRDSLTLSGLLQELGKDGPHCRVERKIWIEACDRKYVGVPGMNSICEALCNEPGICVESRFGAGVGQLHWLARENSWILIGIDGQGLGNFDGVVTSDKNIVSSSVTAVTGAGPNECFCLEPFPGLGAHHDSFQIPFIGVTFENSKVLKVAHCENSRPRRSTSRWVLHSSKEYAKSIIDKFGLRKPSHELLARVAEDLLRELVDAGLNLPEPFFVKAHRWGSAFPLAGVAVEEKCRWDSSRKVVICGDFCVSPNVEGAIIQRHGRCFHVCCCC